MDNPERIDRPRVQPDLTSRQRRLAREAGELAEAMASAVREGTISSERVDAWIDSLGTDHELPRPLPSR